MMMKNLVKVILIILLVLIAFYIYDKKLPSAFYLDYYRATADLNVRTGAGTKYSILFTLQKGDEVEVLSKKGNWFNIKHHDKIGYAYSKYLVNRISISYITLRLSQQPFLFVIIGIVVAVLFPILTSI